MATYKVIQDVEAEDKILGPLTLKQLIFAIIVAGLGFGAFRVATLTGSVFTAIPFLPFMIIFGALAAPLSKNQPSEVWLAAQIHFFTKPRVKLWDQSDLKEVVHITVPKKEQKHYTDGLSQKQVKSRLEALSSTLDSHGWAIRNATAPTPGSYNLQASDERLICMNNVQSVIDEPQNADIFALNSPETRELDVMIEQSETAHRQQIKQMIQQATQTQALSQNQTQPSYQQPTPQSYNLPVSTCPKPPYPFNIPQQL